MFLLVFFLFGVLRVIFLDYVLPMHVFALCFCLDSFVCFHEFVCWGWYPGVLSGISLFWIFVFCVFLLVCWGWYPWIMYGRRVEGTSRQTAALVRSHIFAVLVSYKSRPSVHFFLLFLPANNKKRSFVSASMLVNYKNNHQNVIFLTSFSSELATLISTIAWDLGWCCVWGWKHPLRVFAFQRETKWKRAQ